MRLTWILQKNGFQNVINTLQKEVGFALTFLLILTRGRFRQFTQISLAFQIQLDGNIIQQSFGIKGNISRRTAWGSFMSASAPYVIAPVEMILVLYKGSWKREREGKENDITSKEFLKWTYGSWLFNGQHKKNAGGHPAPFPVELPQRCMKLFSFVGDVVLDPFVGSGSTLIATYLNKRKGIGIDISKEYCDIAINRLQIEANIDQQNLFL